MTLKERLFNLTLESLEKQKEFHGKRKEALKDIKKEEKEFSDYFEKERLSLVQDIMDNEAVIKLTDELADELGVMDKEGLRQSIAVHSLIYRGTEQNEKDILMKDGGGLGIEDANKLRTAIEEKAERADDF